MRPRSQSVIIIYNAAARGETTSPRAHAAKAHTHKRAKQINQFSAPATAAAATPLVER